MSVATTLIGIYLVGLPFFLLFWFWGGLKSQYYRHGLAYALTIGLIPAALVAIVTALLWPIALPVSIYFAPRV